MIVDFIFDALYRYRASTGLVDGLVEKLTLVFIGGWSCVCHPSYSNPQEATVFSGSPEKWWWTSNLMLYTY